MGPWSLKVVKRYDFKVTFLGKKNTKAIPTLLKLSIKIDPFLTQSIPATLIAVRVIVENATNH